MAEQPDTAAMRAEVAQRAHVCVNGTLVHVLCAALDEARAERDEAQAHDSSALAKALERCDELLERAAREFGVMAEHARTMHARAERAEAVIARVEAAKINYDKPPSAEYRRGAEDALAVVRTALRGDGGSG